jgi:transmembrane sensor
MSISDELLDKYFKGQCSPEELRTVLNYLNKTEDLPDHLLSEQEWDETGDIALSDIKTEEMLNVVKRQTTDKLYRFEWSKIVAVAAVILVLLAIGILSLNQDKPKTDLVKNKVQGIEKANEINWKSVMNYTEYDQLFTLPDNSTVKIYPGSELRYAVPFVKNKREVYLNGKSFFEVTKDRKHPFIVYAKGISTTALGTSFTITALEKSRFISVKLHTGKVWVKDADSTHRISAFDKILLPGNELVYNKLINKVSVSDSRNLAIAAENTPKELSFTQAALTEVFATLEKQYKVKIIYDRSDLAEMSFTGSLKRSQSIDSILEEIAELNKLNQTKTTEGYLIRK